MQTDAVRAAAAHLLASATDQSALLGYECELSRDILLVTASVTEMAARIERLEAALEAAERLVFGDTAILNLEPSEYEGAAIADVLVHSFCRLAVRYGHAPDCPWMALAAALRGAGE